MRWRSAHKTSAASDKEFGEGPFAEGLVRRFAPEFVKRLLGRVADGKSFDYEVGAVVLELHRTSRPIWGLGLKIGRGQVYASLHMSQLHGERLGQMPSIRKALGEVARWLVALPEQDKPSHVVGVSYERLTRVAARRFGFKEHPITWSALNGTYASDLRDVMQWNASSAHSPHAPRNRMADPGVDVGMIYLTTDEFVENFAGSGAQSDKDPSSNCGV